MNLHFKSGNVTNNIAELHIFVIKKVLYSYVLYVELSFNGTHTNQGNVYKNVLNLRNSSNIYISEFT